MIVPKRNAIREPIALVVKEPEVVVPATRPVSLSTLRHLIRSDTREFPFTDSRR